MRFQLPDPVIFESPMFKGSVRVKTNAYSERCYRRARHGLVLEHYPDVLSHKPGAFAGSNNRLDSPPPRSRQGRLSNGRREAFGCATK